MAAPIELAHYKDLLIVLGAAGVVIPVCRRLRLSPVFGFVAVGVLAGPQGLGALSDFAPWVRSIVITDREAIAPIAELGVALLLFMIGLELSFERLLTSRRLVFGFGAAQVGLSALAIGAAAVALGQPVLGAITLGLALAMSSTAVVAQTLSEHGRLNRPVGRLALAALVFQDIAVVPILFALTVLAAPAGGPAAASFGAAAAQAIVVTVFVVVLGRLLLRPLFRFVADAGGPESFVAASLLVVLGASIATALAGLSMAFGALIAGLLLAETEYRRQIEVTIEPFKGLLVGVFLISVGLQFDLELIVSRPLSFAAALAALLGVKALLAAAALKAFGRRWSEAGHAALLLAAGGEFAFVLLGLGRERGLLDAGTSAFALTLVAASMPLIPALDALGGWLAQRRRKAAAPVTLTELPEEAGEGPVTLIFGFGRVGRIVAEMLETHGEAYLAIDSDAGQAAAGRRAGKPVAWGDDLNPAFLRRCGLESARAAVITIGAKARTGALVAALRAERPDLTIVVRASDARDAARLYRLGATDAVPETLEASLVLAEQVLFDLGKPAGPVIASIHDRRAAFRAEIQAIAPDSPVPARVRQKRRPEGGAS